VTAKRIVLPPAWHRSLESVAAEFGCHRDEVLYYADAGLILPAALVHKTLLPVAYPGPCPYLVVRLDDYHSMAWAPVDGDMVAPLVGSHRAYQVDGKGFVNLEIDGAGVLVRRSDLVLTIDQVDALQDACGTKRSPHPAKLRTLQQILGALIADRWSDSAGPYTIAENILVSLQLKGVSLSKECVATHVREARAELSRPELIALTRRAANSRDETLGQAA
jgi:hypothetical protein